MRTFFELLGTHVQLKEFDLRHVIAEGDDVGVYWAHGLRGQEDGPGHRHHVRPAHHGPDGRITRYHLYEDTYAVAKAYFDE